MTTGNQAERQQQQQEQETTTDKSTQRKSQNTSVHRQNEQSLFLEDIRFHPTETNRNDELIVCNNGLWTTFESFVIRRCGNASDTLIETHTIKNNKNNTNRSPTQQGNSDSDAVTAAAIAEAVKRTAIHQDEESDGSNSMVVHHHGSHANHYKYHSLHQLNDSLRYEHLHTATPTTTTTNNTRTSPLSTYDRRRPFRQSTTTLYNNPSSVLQYSQPAVATKTTTTTTSGSTSPSSTYPPPPPPLPPPQTHLVDFTDKVFIQTFLEKIQYEGLDVLIHHKIQNENLTRPKQAHLYLRQGRKTKFGEFCGPWLELCAEQPRPICTTTSTTTTRLLQNGIDLFDIQSLDKATALQLKQYPLAIPGRSLFLHMNHHQDNNNNSSSDDYVFELQDEAAAVQFIEGMRWVIARLSFHLIIGDPSVSCEMLNIKESHYYYNNDHSYISFYSKNTFFQDTPPPPYTLNHWSAMNDLTNHLIDKSVPTIQ